MIKVKVNETIKKGSKSSMKTNFSCFLHFTSDKLPMERIFLIHSFIQLFRRNATWRFRSWITFFSSMRIFLFFHFFFHLSAERNGILAANLTFFILNLFFEFFFYFSIRMVLWWKHWIFPLFQRLFFLFISHLCMFWKNLIYFFLSFFHFSSWEKL